MADRVIRDIDRDGNGQLSPQEQQAYATRMAQGLSVSLNKRSVTIQAGASIFPDTNTMKAGTGMIVLQFDIPTHLANGPYRLTYINNAPGPETVRLTNCLLPQDASIHVLTQKRSEDQSFYQLDFLVGPGNSAPPEAAPPQKVSMK
ncbi:MAG: EF-hand domain-containing protein [Gluconacetobacter sp.]